MSIISTVGHDVNGILLYFYSLYRVRGLLAYNFLNCLLHLHSIPHTTPDTQYHLPVRLKGPQQNSQRGVIYNLRRIREDG
jgi:hypothetical protein